MNHMVKKIFFFAACLIVAAQICILPARAQANLTTAEANLMANEIEKLLNEPQPRITIPGVEFSDSKAVAKQTFTGQDGNTYLSLPFLGEYMAAVYRYAVIVIGILAVVRIIMGGFSIATSGGSSEGIESGKTKISQAVVGLILAVGSYFILNLVNPELVSFKNLRVYYVSQEPEALGEADTTDYAVYQQLAVPIPTVQPTLDSGTAPEPRPRTPVLAPSWTHETFDCNNKDSYQPRGVVPKSELETYTCPGIFGTITSIPEMHEPLCVAGELFAKKKTSLVIKDSYRSFKEQVDLWCGRGAQEYPDKVMRKKFFAVPGYSSHGHGNAIDVHFADEKGKRYYENVNSKTQCDQAESSFNVVANVLYAVDPNFKRLESEIWHFEYGVSSNPKVGDYRGYPASCNKS